MAINQPTPETPKVEPALAENSKLSWHQEARFGNTIHRGACSVAERGDWVRPSERMTVEDYEPSVWRLAPGLDYAWQWAQLAKRSAAGNLQGRMKDGRLFRTRTEVPVCEFWNWGAKNNNGPQDIFFIPGTNTAWTNPPDDLNDTVVRFSYTADANAKNCWRNTLTSGDNIKSVFGCRLTYSFFKKTAKYDHSTTQSLRSPSFLCTP